MFTGAVTLSQHFRSHYCFINSKHMLTKLDTLQGYMRTNN